MSEPKKTKEAFAFPPIKWMVKECKMIKEMKKSYACNSKVQNSTLNFLCISFLSLQRLDLCSHRINRIVTSISHII